MTYQTFLQSSTDMISVRAFGLHKQCTAVKTPLQVDAVCAAIGAVPSWWIASVKEAVRQNEAP